MKSAVFSRLDHPAFQSVAPYAARLQGACEWPSVDALDALFRDRLALAKVALERQEKIPSRRRGLRSRADVYEIRIHDRAKIPTRAASWHDLANVLVWCAFPNAKRALTARQHAIVDARVSSETRGLPPMRTREQDALAMLDEGGLLLISEDSIDIEGPDAVHAALAGGRATLRVFGHALLEAVAEDGLHERDLRGSLVPLSVGVDMDEIDRALAAYIADANNLLTPVPRRSLWLRAALAVQPSF